eukprot:m.85147 g.85147  ORF g.85147 m.85147 type:complete len:273 (+) comp25836_c0_seq1:175-993(+)
MLCITSFTAVFALMIGVNVQAQPDETPCDNNAAYDTSAGTMQCNGVTINVKNLVCGDGFSQTNCVAQWQNQEGKLEEYFFMGAGSGMSASQLPEECDSKFPDTTGLAMVQYYPDGGCYPAADLLGTTATYTSDGAEGVKSVTLNFAGHNDGSAWRDGYMKINCGTSQSGFTTTGDLNEPSTYEVEVTFPCVGGNSDAADGIDDGGVLLIVVFVAGFIYFVGGATYLSQVKKLEGNQRIPHVEFWSSLPGLVKEGVMFCKGKILGTVSYAPVP